MPPPNVSLLVLHPILDKPLGIANNGAPVVVRFKEYVTLKVTPVITLLELNSGPEIIFIFVLSKRGRYRDYMLLQTVLLRLKLLIQSGLEPAISIFHPDASPLHQCRWSLQYPYIAVECWSFTFYRAMCLLWWWLSLMEGAAFQLNVHSALQHYMQPLTLFMVIRFTVI